MAVVDASVVVALVNAHEEAHASAWGWLRRVRTVGTSLHSPIVLLTEVGATLSHGLGNPNLAHMIVRQLQGSTIVELVAITPSLSRRAATLAIDHRIRGCDALYIALARQRQEELITLDPRQLQYGNAVVTTRRPAP